MVGECIRWWVICCVVIMIDFWVVWFWIIENVLKFGFFESRNELSFILLDKMGRSFYVVIDVFGKWRGIRYEFGIVKKF